MYSSWREAWDPGPPSPPPPLNPALLRDTEIQLRCAIDTFQLVHHSRRRPLRV